MPHQQPLSDTVSWTVTAENTGDVNAENVEIVDILGNGFSNIAFSSLGGVQGIKTENDPKSGFTTITWTGLSIPAAGSITGTINASASKKQLDMNNDISIKGACPSGCIYSSDSDHAEVSDIELAKTPEESRKTIGEEADFKVAVEFFSNVAYKNVQIIDTIPAGLKYLSAVCDNCGSDPEVTTDTSGNTILKWTLGDFLGPRICNITIKTVVKNITSNVDPTDLINNVDVKDTIDGSEKTVSDSAVVHVIEPKLVLEKTAYPTTAEAGDKIEYTLHLYHHSASNNPASDVDIIDTIPAELAYVPGSIQIVSGPSGTADPSGSPQLKWHFDQVDQSWTQSNPIVLKYEATMGNVNPGLKITNTAKATWSSLPPNPENPEIRDNYQSSSSQDVYSMKVILEKTSQPKPLDVNKELTYTITYKIEGVTDATNVLIKEEYDDNVEFVSADPAPCQSEGDNNIWKSGCPLLDTIPPGEYTIKIVVKPKLPLKNGTIIKNLVKYKSDQMGEKEISFEEENEILSPIPIISKVANPNTVRAGSELSYKILIENAGRADATDIVVSDEYDPRVEFVSSDIPPDQGTNNRWTFPLLKPGDKKVINIVVKVQSTVPNGAILINSYRMETKQSDPIQGTLETKVVNKLNVTKKTAKEAAVRGEEIPYVITICNPGGIPATNVVVTDVFSSEVELLWAYPQPLPSGVWFFPVIGPGDCVQIEFAVRVPSPEADFQMGQSVEGTGFVNVANDYKTTLPGFVLRNDVTVTADKLIPSYATADVNIKFDPGTELKTREHGSGIYDTEEKINYKLGNKSIEMAKDLKADHKLTSFTYPGNWSIDYGSKWTESAKAKNRATGATMEETYRYATSLDRDNYMKLDKNESLMVVNSSFDGMGYIGFSKREAPNSTIHSTPLFESREDYSGRFKIYEKIQEYGRSVRSEQSANGTGAVAAEKQIKKSQKSYQYGVGSYQLEEMVDSPSNYISKEVNLSHSPYSFTYGPNRTIDRDGLWKEGMWSKVKNSSFIGEEFDSLNYLHKDSSAKGLNEMETEAEFSGQARLRAEAKGSVSLDDQYVGDISLKRKILLGGTAKYDQPHLWVEKEVKIAKGVLNGKETVFAIYTIQILNDGSRSLGPIHITDYMPPHATYVNSSLMPDSLGAGYVNWTLVYLGIGMSNTIELTLAVKEEQPDLVNRVLVEGGYDNSWVLASNMSVIENSWLSCCPPQMQLSKKAWINPSSPNTVWYEISLRNRANYTMAAALTDSLPDRMVLINSSTAPDQQDSSKLVWNIIDLEPGQERSVIYSARALRNGSFTNLAKVEAYSLEGRGSVTAEAAATVTIGDVKPPEKREGEDWKAQSCMGLNCTQKRVGNDFISCYSCGGGDAQNLCPACSKPACQDCIPEDVM